MNDAWVTGKGPWSSKEACEALSSVPSMQKVLNKRGQPGLPWGLSLGLLTGMTPLHALSPVLVPTLLMARID